MLDVVVFFLLFARVCHTVWICVSFCHHSCPIEQLNNLCCTIFICLFSSHRTVSAWGQGSGFTYADCMQRWTGHQHLCRQLWWCFVRHCLTLIPLSQNSKVLWSETLTVKVSVWVWYIVVVLQSVLHDNIFPFIGKCYGGNNCVSEVKGTTSS